MAQISIIEGINKGETFELIDEETFIGRESSNQIVLNDSSVSRRHCSIKSFDNQFIINDLKSLNGTLVNDKNAQNKLLDDGDKITIGDFVFLFKTEIAENLPVSSTVFFDKSQIDLSKSVRISLDEVFGAMARDLSALLKISAKINLLRTVESLQKELLNEIFEVVPSQTGAIILVDGNGDLVEVFGLNRMAKNGDITISQTIINQVLNEKKAILVNNVASNQALTQAKSLFLTQTSSVLCAPLVVFEENIGAIYLASSQNNTLFDENHLRFITALAGISAIALENVKNFERVEKENTRLREESLFSKNMLGESDAIKKVFTFIYKVAPGNSTVLITGESGTGKELAAQAIHLNSQRNSKPFVAINCAALSENLLESELFGHERGAFTGAVTQKIGKIEFANGGTLFLDEIGEMALNLQAKLLRVLQERVFERVGGIKTIKADIRLITATNRNLETEIKNGNFREDLFYRLNVVRLQMPNLRERKSDILLLAEHFTEKFSQNLNRRVRGISAKARKLLQNYDFPGNVRELENAIERAIVLGESDWILPEDLPENIWESADLIDFKIEDSSFNYYETLQLKKKDLIFKAFAAAQGSYLETAKLLDIHPNYLHRLIRNLNIKTELEQSFKAKM
ncbi:MAG TPA: sigma 54-interacting transcriptional regulator [Pyrinomonadaceae bacterium]|nr:sigma 54-interacting transcriptional regulator [Pyrinomonadaceae bacterium]